jgi:hypothetical protein
MYGRRMISAILIVFGLFSLWMLYWSPLYVLIRAHYPISIWSMIVLFPLPLIVVGTLIWKQPYRLGNGRALPYYLYTSFCIIISSVLIMTLGIEKHAPGAPAVPVVNSIEWQNISEQLPFLLIFIVVFCVPLWLVFLLAWHAGRQRKAEV